MFPFPRIHQHATASAWSIQTATASRRQLSSSSRHIRRKSTLYRSQQARYAGTSRPPSSGRPTTTKTSSHANGPGSYSAATQQAASSVRAARERINDLDRYMNYRGYHTLRWTVGIMGVTGLSMYIFRDEITDSVGTAGADITSRTLGDKDVQREARQLARGFVYELLNDKYALQLTSEFLNSLLGREYTRDAVIQLLANVAAQKETQALIQELLRNVMLDPVFILTVAGFVEELCAKETTKVALINLLSVVFADPAMQVYTSKFFADVMGREWFIQGANGLMAQTLHDTLEDGQVKEHAVKWAREALGEPDLHSQAGDAIWGAIRSTFIPGFLGGGRSTPPAELPAKPLLRALPTLQSTEHKISIQSTEISAAIQEDGKEAENKKDSQEDLPPVVVNVNPDMSVKSVELILPSQEQQTPDVKDNSNQSDSTSDDVCTNAIVAKEVVIDKQGDITVNEVEVDIVGKADAQSEKEESPDTNDDDDDDDDDGDDEKGSDTKIEMGSTESVNNNNNSDYNNNSNKNSDAGSTVDAQPSANIDAEVQDNNNKNPDDGMPTLGIPDESVTAALAEKVFASQRSSLRRTSDSVSVPSQSDDDDYDNEASAGVKVAAAAVAAIQHKQRIIDDANAFVAAAVAAAARDSHLATHTRWGLSEMNLDCPNEL